MPFDNPFNPEFFPVVPAHDAERRDLTMQRIDLTLEYGMQVRAAGPARRNELAALIDSHIREIFASAHAPREGIAVVAHGSLGRRDLGPVSPFDIAVLWDDTSRLMSSDTASAHDPGQVASHVWRGLWEMGASFNRGVYSLTQCTLMASGELEALIPLLDLRYIAGDERVAQRALARVREAWKDALETREAEVEKLAEDRRSSYPLLAYSTEPNLILDRGGLKDATLIRAVTRGLPVDSRWQSHPDQAPHVQAAASLLRDVRDALQVVRRSGTGRLLASDQEAVAAFTGFHDADDLMAALSDAARTLLWELRRILRVARSVLGNADLPHVDADVTWIPASARLTMRDGALDFLDSAERQAIDYLAAVRFSSECGVDLSSDLLADMASHAPGAPRTLTPDEHVMLVGALAGPYVRESLEALDVHGVLDSWVPGWRETPKRTREAGTRFTLERHLFQTLYEAGRVPGVRPLVLFASVCVHRGERGAEALARTLGCSDSDARAIGILAQHRTLLADLTRARDLLDPEAATRIAQALGPDSALLADLLALTLAEERAGAEGNLPAWRRESLEFLAHAAQAVMSGHECGDGAGEEARDKLATVGGINPHVTALALAAVQKTHRAAVVFRPGAGADGSRHIVVAAPERPQALLHITHMAAEFGIALMSGHFEVKGQVVLSAWLVRPRGTELPHPSVLKHDLNRRLGLEASAPRAHRRTPPSPVVTPRAVSRVEVTRIEAGAAGLVALRVNADDRPRLIGDLVSAISGYPIAVRTLNVVRLESRIVTTFYFAPARGKDAAPELVQRLTAVLERAAKGR